MKEIKAVIQPFMLNKVLDALTGHPGLRGLVVAEVTAYGRQCACEAPIGTEENEGFLGAVPMKRLEILVIDDMVDQVHKLVADNARTGSRGDGNIRTASVEKAAPISPGGCGRGECPAPA